MKSASIFKLSSIAASVLLLASCGGGGGDSTTTQGTSSNASPTELTFDTSMASTSATSRTAVTLNNGTTYKEVLLNFVYKNTGTTDLIIGSISYRAPSQGDLVSDADTLAFATKPCWVTTGNTSVILKAGESCQYPLKWRAGNTGGAIATPADVDVRVPLFYYGSLGGNPTANTTADVTLYYRFQ